MNRTTAHLLVVTNEIIHSVGTYRTEGVAIEADHDLLAPKVRQLHGAPIAGLQLKVGRHVAALEEILPAALLFTQTRPRSCIGTGGAICGIITRLRV